MKMAKLPTKKLNDFDLEKIRRFTEQELAKLSQSSFPFCYQVGTTVRVGNNFVMRKSDNCWQVREGKINTFDFLSRKDAIYYCIALHKNKHEVAKEIKQNDQQLSRLEQDAIIYRKRYNQAVETGNGFKEDLYSSRYHDTMDKITDIKENLKKCYELAK
jgi:hypothetical protein